MTEKEFWNQINSDEELPEIVQMKAKEAFAQIALESEIHNMIKMPNTTKHTTRRPKKLLFAGLLAGTIAVTGVAAAVLGPWSHGTENYYHVTADQKEAAETSGLAAVPDSAAEQVSDTANGITISVAQTLVDEKYGHVAFRIEGLDLEEDVEPMFEKFNFESDTADFSWGASFYNGFVSSTDGTGFAVHEDGSPIQEGDLAVYRLADGSYEYLLNFHGMGQSALPGQTVHAHFKDLGIAGKAEMADVLVKGEWDLSWTLSGSDQVHTTEPADEGAAILGDTGAVVTEAKITPLSIAANLDWARQTETETYTNENGEEDTITYYAEPPYLTGVRLKDGTLLRGITNGGSMGYTSVDEADTNWTYSFAVDVILDPEEVDALLFVKSYPEEDGTPLSEENLYIVPLK